MEDAGQSHERALRAHREGVLARLVLPEPGDVAFGDLIAHAA